MISNRVRDEGQFIREEIVGNVYIIHREYIERGTIGNTLCVH